MIRPGCIVQHYKGGLYQILFKAQHHDTQESMFVYQSMSHKSTNKHPRPIFFVRPCSEFGDLVAGPPSAPIPPVPRFRLVDLNTLPKY